MFIKYYFVTGEVAEVEVSEEIGTVIADVECRQRLRNRAETRRHYHYDDPKVYEGLDYGIEDRGLLALETKGEVEAAMSVLTDSQREVILTLFLESLPAKEYAQRKGISEAAVCKTKKAALKKMRDFLEHG